MEEIYGNVETLRHAWHYRNLTRQQAEELLCQQSCPGSYLVRESSSGSNTVLCVIDEAGLVVHYLISRNEDGSVQFKDRDDRVYPDLEALIEHCTRKKRLRVLLTQPCELPVSAAGAGSMDARASGTASDATEDEDEDDDEEGDEEQDFNTVLERELRTAASQQARLRSDAHLHKVFEEYIHFNALGDAGDAHQEQTLAKFRALVAELGKPLLQELQTFQTRLDALRNVFQSASMQSNIKPPIRIEHPDVKEGSDELTRLSTSLAFSKSLVNNVEAFATSYLKGLLCKHGSGGTAPAVELSAMRTFDVRRVDQMMKTSTVISVNLSEGFVSIGKDDPKPYKHDEILQLIKSRSNKQRLGVVLSGKRKDFVFESLAEREEFCQLVQSMKNRLGDDKATDYIRNIDVFIGTFNMGDAVPKDQDLSTWFRCDGTGTGGSMDPSTYDIVAVGTQESGGSERDWISTIKAVIGSEFYQVAFVRLLAIRLVVFAKQAHQNLISHLQQGTVATGIANKLGNKGGVGISFFFEQTSLCFLNCHLAASANKVLRRKANIQDILGKLQLGQKKLVGFDVASQFHHIFWFGDLNYRLDYPREEVLDVIKANRIEDLLRRDQLRTAMHEKTILAGFDEGRITFKPTYRYKRGARNEYTIVKHKPGGVKKINVPSYCDRVLWRSFPDTRIRQLAYGCTTNIVTSDHSPVYSVFKIGVRSQYVPKHDPSAGSSCRLHIAGADATIETRSATEYFLEFFGTFFSASGSLRTKNNRNGSCNTPQWTAEQIDAIQPIISERACLEQEHLLIAVKSADSEEVIGVGCISLMGLFHEEPQLVRCLLTYRGVCMGELVLSAFITGAVGESQANSVMKVGDVDDESYSRTSTLSSTRRQTYRTPEELNAMRLKRSSRVLTGRHRSSASDYEQPDNLGLEEDGSNSPPPPLPPRRGSDNTTLSPPTAAPPPRRPSRSAASQPLTITSAMTTVEATVAAVSGAESGAPPPPVPRKSERVMSMVGSDALAIDTSAAALHMEPKPETPSALFDQIGHPELAPLFVQAGYDDLEFFGDITEDELEEIGVGDQQLRQLLMQTFKHATSCSDA